jgi:hypothetical protein
VFTYWVNRRHRLHESIDPNLFTPVALQAFMKIMERGTQEGDSTAVKAPEDFKAGSKWKVFKESAIAYFNSVRTKGDIPLAYVIREQRHNDADDEYESEHQRLVSLTPLEGYEFEEDNGIVFDYLKSWTIKGPAFIWIKAYDDPIRNGRAAWMALLQHYEGDAQRDHVKDAAYSTIANTKYYGEKKKFSFGE